MVTENTQSSHHYVRICIVANINLDHGHNFNIHILMCNVYNGVRIFV